jgi:hypothetical protein
LSGIFRLPRIPLGISVEDRVLEIVGLDLESGLKKGRFSRDSLRGCSRLGFRLAVRLCGRLSSRLRIGLRRGFRFRFRGWLCFGGGRL